MIKLKNVNKRHKGQKGIKNKFLSLATELRIDNEVMFINKADQKLKFALINYFCEE